MTCKDCIHHDVCYLHKHYGADEYCVDCRKFKDKSRILELPCNAGETLYYPWVYDGTSGIAMLEAAYVRFYVGGMYVVGIKNPESDMPMPSYFYDEEFGHTVFLTREEAEEALRKEQE